MAAKATLRDDDKALISFEPGEGRRAIVSFTGIGLGMGGGIQTEEFKKTLQGASDIYYVTDHHRSWFNRCFDEILETLVPHIQARGAESVMTIGNSMGGTGALMFAGHLPNCRAAIAFSAQSSVDARLVPFETRYREWVDRIESYDVPDSLPHLRDDVRYYLIYGRKNVLDHQHATRVLRAPNGQVTAIGVGDASHNVASVLKASGVSLRALIDALSDAPETMREVLAGVDVTFRRRMPGDPTASDRATARRPAKPDDSGRGVIDHGRAPGMRLNTGIANSAPTGRDDQTVGITEMNLKELVARVAEETGRPAPEVKRILLAGFGALRESVVNEPRVSITRFGSFVQRSSGSGDSRYAFRPYVPAAGDDAAES